MHLSSFKTPNANIKCAISTIQMHTKYLFGFKLIWRLRFVFCDFLFFIYYLLFIFITCFSFFRRQKSLFTYCSSLFMYSSCIVHGTYNPFIQKKILKMGHTVLFTHLQIILLQYFQFLVLVKINCTRMKSKIFGGHVSYLGPHVTQPGTRCMFGGHTHSVNSINRKSPILKVKDAEPTLINMSR